MTTYLKHIFALVAALVFAGCDLLGDLDFLPGKPDGGDDAPAEEAFRSVRGDFDGFDELVYNDDTLICYRESDAGLPEAMFIFTNDGGEEVAEMVYFDGDGIPVYFNVNGESIYVENIRGELCDLVILSDDGTFSTIPDVATGFDIANYWSEHPATRADGSNVANGVNMANRVLGARYFAEGSFGMGLSAYGMLLGCAMLVPGCNVVIGATLMIGSAVGFVASSMQIARATDLLVSDGSHTDGAYIATGEVLDIISNVVGTPVVVAANILIDRGFDAVYDELNRRSQEQERLKQSRSVQSLTLTTGSADVDYCNRSARLSGSLSSTLSSDDRVGILISDDPSGLHVVDCYDTEASAGEFEFEFSDLERCKSYFYRSYYVSESEQRSYVSKCREFYVPGVKTAGYTQLSEGSYEVILEAMLGDKLASADVGICYSSDNSEPTIEDDYTDPCEVSRSDSYTFTIECEELPCYYRAFMIVEEGIIYGTTRSIYANKRLSLVSPQSGVELEHGESVDVTFMVEAYSPVTGQYWACEDAAVVFETESGELSEGVAISDDKGMVSVTWSPTATRAATKSHTLYARIYASDGAIIDEATFVVKTEAEGGDDANHPHAVDLGLSVKWACCNVGASNPEDYGDYFAWGETSPKSSYYTAEDYQLWVDYDGDRLWDYGELTIYSDISGTQYDAARVNWGGSWRMPTIAEFIELSEECEWTWTSVNGIKGMRVTGPSGNSIFLSAAGSIYCNWTATHVDELCCYWSSTPYEDDGYYAYYFVSMNDWLDWPYWTFRDRGFTVRPVTE